VGIFPSYNGRERMVATGTYGHLMQLNIVATQMCLIMPLIKAARETKTVSQTLQIE